MAFFAPTVANVTRDLVKSVPGFEWEVSFREIGICFQCVGKKMRGVETPLSSEEGRVIAGRAAETLASKHKDYGFKVYLLTDDGLLVGMEVKRGARTGPPKAEKLDYW